MASSNIFSNNRCGRHGLCALILPQPRALIYSGTPIVSIATAAQRRRGENSEGPGPVHVAPGAVGAVGVVGAVLGRIVALYYRSSTSYQIR